ncbi:Hpt domain protein [Candidatus Rickettsiella viridis]|uniref:Hpt domain protein n=1 Tax=Candidatus Rickettsiella viridis TaxID=676208 RepID=A0A2Z5UVM4_9COXI|nr:Hpt domain-containing protein [Candidatus Rickettsiella viridis]BBB15548.1 Hpt domain protein [Candidatus Rickettsiella viridis]
MEKDRPTLAIINLDLDKEFTKDSYKLLRELLQHFIKEVPEFQKEINHAFQDKEKQKLNDQLHKLTGSCLYCGLDRLKTSLLLLKAAINENNYDRNLLDDLNQEMKNAKEEAKNFIVIASTVGTKQSRK